jgi:hypothetical protein
MYDDRDDYLTVAQCARRLNLTEDRVLELAKRGILRSFYDGVLWVQPALIRGVTA